MTQDWETRQLLLLCLFPQLSSRGAVAPTCNRDHLSGMNGINRFRLNTASFPISWNVDPESLISAVTT